MQISFSSIFNLTGLSRKWRKSWFVCLALLILSLQHLAAQKDSGGSSDGCVVGNIDYTGYFYNGQQYSSTTFGNTGVTIRFPIAEYITNLVGCPYGSSLGSDIAGPAYFILKSPDGWGPNSSNENNLLEFRSDNTRNVTVTNNTPNGDYYGVSVTKGKTDSDGGVDYLNVFVDFSKATGPYMNTNVYFFVNGYFSYGKSSYNSFNWSNSVGPIRVGNPLHNPQIDGSQFTSDGKVNVAVSIPNYYDGNDKGSSSTQVYVKPPNQKTIKYATIDGNAANLNFTFTPTLDQLNSGITIDAEVARYDNLYIGSNPVYANSPAFTIPKYPQPSNLTPTLSKGRVKLTWKMIAGDANSPTDGYSIQWRKNNGTWADVPGVAMPYNSSETNCSVDFPYPEINQNTNDYEFKVKRANMNDNFAVSQTVKINTNYIDFTTTGITATPATDGITLNWSLTDGYMKDGYQIKITRNDSRGSHLLTSNLDIFSGTYTDATAFSCDPSSYMIDIMDGANVIREVNSQTVVRPDSDPGEITSLKVSKGFYNDRVIISWQLSQGASFNRFTINRKLLSDPNSVEQQVTEFSASGLTQYSYDDKNPIPGVYYTYIVRGWVDCSGTSNIASEVASTGFIQPLGIVSGRISYTGSIAVKDVQVIATGQNGGKNKSLTLNDGLSVNIPYKKGNFSTTDFTFQAWVKAVEVSDTTNLIFDSSWRYTVRILPDNKIFFTHCFLDNTADVTFDAFTLPVNEYKHISITSSADTVSHILTAKLYVDGALTDSISKSFTGTPGFRDDSTGSVIGSWNTTGVFNCFIDELRIWNRALSADEIKSNYDRYITGQESGLTMYYRFDEEGGNEIFDISGANGIFNENHGVFAGGNSSFRSEFEVPTPDQLAIKAVTDSNGYYLLNTIPYTGSGTTFTITPTMGVHNFDPDNRPLYFSQTSSTQNNIDFTDVSSFNVSGTVTYEGGTYPVEGCSFEIDGKPVTFSNGELVKTDNEGNFGGENNQLRVPIGIHSLRIVKQGHTFANNGYLIDETTGANLNYNAPLANIKFSDQTRVKLIGRVVGGVIENGKPLGFGESVNNIGMQTITLNSTNSAYKYLNSDTTLTFYHNQGQWKKKGGLQDDSTKVTYSQTNITIQVSPVTGEFAAMVYPEPYNIGEIKVPAAGGATLSIYNNGERLDLTTAAFPDSSYLQTSVRTWTDSTFVSGKQGVVDHYESFDASDTVRYNAKWTYYYQATPTFSLKQVVNNIPVDYFGDETYILTDNLTNETDTLNLYDESKGTYLFGKPVFRQGTNYTFHLKAYEEYSNNVSDPTVTTTYPVTDGTVNMMNNIQVTPAPETVDMDENGEADYTFMAGAPNLTTGSNNFFATLTLGSISYNWDLVPQTQPVDVWHLGDKSTGTDFMTAGPDQITTILRDPPGTKSKAFIEQGSTFTTKYGISAGIGVNTETSLTAELGPKITTFIGLGAGVIDENDVKLDISAGLKTETKLTAGLENTQTTTFTERFETSDDPLYVGFYGDVFIGNSTNILYGLTNSITIQKNYENQFQNADDGKAFADTAINTNTHYSIAPSVSIAYGQSFATRFAYTQAELETIMIPKWVGNLAILLQPLGTTVDQTKITNPVYVSNLPADDPNFGKLNTDKIAFPQTAVTEDHFDNGPSYTIVFPKNYNMANFQTDSVMYFNNQIDGWTNLLARNEQEKVEMTKLGNYSFGGGASIQYSTTSTASQSITSTFHTMISPTIGLVTGGEVMGIGLELSTKTEYIVETDITGEINNETSISSGFTLQEDGDDDEITVDYGMTASGTIAFKTRGGRTSCPYEGEVLTKYYKPGQYTLDEATMQIEVPKINVASAPQVINVPANRAATYTLNLQNESETGENVWFELITDESTNPDGAVLKIDGGVIGNGRLFLVNAGQTLQKTLTLEKGTANTYNNIALVLRSQCQNDPTTFVPVITDTTYVSAEFIPAVSDVAISEPKSNWILNADSQTGDTLNITIDGYDVNFPNFGYIKLEYRPVSSPDWNTITTFYPTSLYTDAQGVKENIGTRSVITYPWKMPTADGQYELRATTASVNIVNNAIVGNPLSTYTTDAVAGYKDMQRPVSLGAPSPANGILGVGDELSITYNEDIQTGMLTQNNFSISGVLNAQPIAEPNVGLAFTGVESAQTELPIFTSGSFSIETWFKHNANTAGTLFAYGTNENFISLGFDTNGKAVLKIGSESYTSSTAITDDETWKYIAMVYDREMNTVSVYEFEGASNKILFNAQALKAIPETQGKLVVGDGYKGALAQLHFYGISRTQTDVSAGKSVTKTGKEYGLIGYWALDEGQGNVAVDKARSRNLVLNNTGWYIYPSGYAKQTAGNYFSIPVAAYPLDVFSDFTLEFWFRSASNNQTNQTLFSCDYGSIGLDANSKLTLYKADGTANQTLTGANLSDAKWHHVALSVRRGGNVNVYIDGATTATFSESLLGTFASGNYYFGAKHAQTNTFSQYFAGYFDEIRIWNSALTGDGVLLNQNSKLSGSEAGLQAYYPFENYNKQDNGLITVTSTNKNITDDGKTSASGTATGLSTTAMSVKDVRPIEDVPFSYVASNSKIVFTLDPTYFARVEGSTLNISASNIRDMHDNKSNTESWTAFVNRNTLRWDADPVNITMQAGELRTFTARITNTGGTTLSYSIENLPSWLMVNSSTGSLQPLANKDLTFTVYQGINIGNYETAVGLASGNGVSEILPVQVKVTGQRPDWTVNPNDFQLSMSIMGQIQIVGIYQEDTDDILAAFIGDLCVGVTSPIYVDDYNAYFTFATIYGNPNNNGQSLTFKLWDASTGRVYPSIDVSRNGSPLGVKFYGNDSQGTPDSPVLFNALDVVEQSIALNNGWNWISFNVDNNDPTLITQFKSNALTYSSQLKSNAGLFINKSGANWVGSLSSIDIAQTYLVNNTQTATLRMTGKPADPATTPITLKANNWSWIGYTPQFSLPAKDALAGIVNPQKDDQIKGYTGYLIMGSNGWVGNLATMEPGKGYMYRSNNSKDVTFIYPSVSSMLRSAEADQEIAAVELYWTPNTGSFDNYMSIISYFTLDRQDLEGDQYEVGCFIDNECRGVYRLVKDSDFYAISGHSYPGYLSVYGSSADNGKEITVRVYDHLTAKTYEAAEKPLYMYNDILGGKDDFPYKFTLSAPTGIHEVSKEESLNAYMRDGILHVSGLTAGKPWMIYTVSGMLIYRDIATDAKETRDNTLLRLIRGIYIIQSEGKSVKIKN